MNNAMDFIKRQLKPGYKVMVSLMAAKGKEEYLYDEYNEFEYNNTYLTKYENNENYGAIVIFNDGNTNIEFKGKTTMLYSKLVSNYFNEEYIPYVKVSEVVQAKIKATKGE